MIRTISIKSFKSLLDVKFELGKVNVFVGANGSGKSNLLEALGVASAAASGRVDDESLIRRGVRPGLPALYKSSFKGARIRPSIGLEVSNSKARYSVELSNPINKPDPAWCYKNEKLVDGDKPVLGRSPASKEKLDPRRGLAALKAVELSDNTAPKRLLAALESYAIYCANTNTLRGVAPDPQAREPVGLAGGRLPEAVMGLLRSTADKDHTKNLFDDIFKLIDWAQPSLGFANNQVRALMLSPSVATAKHVLRFKDRYMGSGRNQLTAYDASEGALYVLFAFVLASHAKAPAILAMDNFDHGLNPRLARALTSQFCRRVLENRHDKQVLLTTHNPLVLDGLPLDNDEVRLFAVGRSRKGRTTIKRIEIDLKRLQKDGELWTVSRLWVMGHLGGMPDV